MDLTELGTYLFPGMRDLLRVEMLDYYDAASDQGDYQRWLDGLPEQPNPGKTAWHNRLRADTANGVTWRRLHVVAEPLTDYLMYECEWGYTANAAAGEDIRIFNAPRAAFDARQDFFVVDNERVALSTYDVAGKFQHADIPTHTRDWADWGAAHWDAGIPFATWWAERPHYHNTRTRRAA